eukprot:2986054-Pleurochrysis_carterae.AAC.1
MRADGGNFFCILGGGEAALQLALVRGGLTQHTHCCMRPQELAIWATTGDVTEMTKATTHAVKRHAVAAT